MPFTTAERFKSIITALSVLRYILKSSAVNGTTDAYKNAERFFEHVLNVTFDLALRNTNQLKHNYPAIDLADKKAKICFQVTGENSSSKIQKTLDKFFEHDLDGEYDTLRFLILTSKRGYTKKFKVPGHFKFAVGDDVLDVDDVLKAIEASSGEKIKAIHDFVTAELAGVLKYFAPPESLLAKAEERANRPFQNARRLIKHLDVQPEEVSHLHARLKRGYKKLSDLSTEIRTYIYLIVTRGTVGRYFSCDRISIAPVNLQGILPIGDRKHSEFYQVVSELGFADVPEGEYPVLLYLTWSTDFDVDLFVAFLEMFGRDSSELRELLVGADFTLLDEE